jgi:hypothetical protein
MGRKLLIIAAAFSFMAGCTDMDRDAVGPDAQSLESSPNSTGLAVGPHWGAVATLDDKFLAVGRDLPGFAGLYFDETGSLVVKMVDAGTVASVSPRVAEFLSTAVFPGEPGVEETSRALSGMRLEEADYSFSSLQAAYRRAVKDVFSVPGVSFGDVDEVRNRIVVGVADPTYQKEVEERLRALPFPNEMFEVVEMPRLSPEANLRGTVRPIVGGVEGILGCTIGFNVGHRINGILQEDWYFLTNSHCTDPVFLWTVDSTMANQPNSGSRVGQEYLDPAGFTEATDSLCPTNYSCRYSDAALIRYDSNIDFQHARVAWPNINDTLFSQKKVVWASGDPIVGVAVNKIGRTTGRTTGEVTATCTWRTASATKGYLCQFEADYASLGGDSGSPIVQQWFSTDSLLARGIHVGRVIEPSGDTIRIFTPFSGWSDELGGTMPGGGILSERIADSPPPGADIWGPEQVNPYEDCEWEADAWGGYPPYTYQWSGVLSGTNSWVGGTVSQSGWLYLVVKDKRNVPSDTASVYITTSHVAECEHKPRS